MTDLAIIVPAFRHLFLKEALESIVNQTCSSFNVYIGNDNGPAEIDKIVEPFLQKNNFHYTRFEKNLGKSSLVKQWIRCIGLSENEPWIWIFADDDIMDKECVASFYNYKSNRKNIDLLRFNQKTINNYGSITFEQELHPETENIEEFLKRRFSFSTNSSVSEFIFSRNVFQKHSIPDFPLAWNSDDATWILFGKENGIQTIPGPFVYWRISGSNISSENHDLIKDKDKANLEYLKWLKKQKPIHDFLKINEKLIIKWWFWKQIVSDNFPGWKTDYSVLKKIKWIIKRLYRFNSYFGIRRSFNSLENIISIFGFAKINTITMYFISIVIIKD